VRDAAVSISFKFTFSGVYYMKDVVYFDQARTLTKLL
jgi:hypothetical protein